MPVGKERAILLVPSIPPAAAVVAASGILLGPFTAPPGPGEIAPEGGDREIAGAFKSRRSGFPVGSHGRLVRIMDDDREGVPHQRFILEPRTGQIVLVSHNLNLAERVPLSVGDDVEFHGMDEWNVRGGIIHWTHDDPAARRAGGWLRHEGFLFRQAPQRVARPRRGPGGASRTRAGAAGRDGVGPARSAGPVAPMRDGLSRRIIMMSSMHCPGA